MSFCSKNYNNCLKKQFFPTFTPSALLLIHLTAIILHFFKETFSNFYKKKTFICTLAKIHA